MTRLTTHPRAGWQQSEVEQLFEAVRDASRLGRPLRDVFDQMGERLNRRPNSIRNFYYARVKESPQLAPAQAPFRSFDERELSWLLREVLMGRGQGESVRACVTRLAGGDRSGMLRYQNKYRSILKNKPELLLETARELCAEGLPCPQNVLDCRRYAAPRDVAEPPHAKRPYEALRETRDPCVKRMLDALCELERRAHAAARAEMDAESVSELHQKWMEARREADRLRVEVDLLKLALEDARKGTDDGWQERLGERVTERWEELEPQEQPDPTI